MMMYESKTQTPLQHTAFIRRVVWHALAALGLLGVSLAIGVAGYATFEQLPWLDGFLNAAMLLGGMGPVNAPVTSAGKLFAAFYALYAGLVFIVAAALVCAPVLHRVLHKFHWDAKQ